MPAWYYFDTINLMDSVEFGEYVQEYQEAQIIDIQSRDRGNRGRSRLRGNVTGAKQKRIEGQPNRPHHMPMSIGELAIRGRLG